MLKINQNVIDNKTNQYNVKDRRKDMSEEKKIVIGITKNQEGQINVVVGQGVPIMDLIVAFGILSVEVPFMIKNLQMQEKMDAAKREHSIITPENIARG